MHIRITEYDFPYVSESLLISWIGLLNLERDNQKEDIPIWFPLAGVRSSTELDQIAAFDYTRPI